MPEKRDNGEEKLKLWFDPKLAQINSTRARCRTAIFAVGPLKSRDRISKRIIIFVSVFLLENILV